MYYFLIYYFVVFTSFPALAHPPIHLITHSLTHSLTHSTTHSLTHSTTHSLTHSTTTNSLTHSPAHSLTHSPPSGRHRPYHDGLGHGRQRVSTIIEFFYCEHYESLCIVCTIIESLYCVHGFAAHVILTFTYTSISSALWVFL